ncbi:MAG: hypothetical protein LCH51_03915 [Bacteroidetes bacterium]|nr:hypothetical protein [Bacteroidota bacterium]
MKTTSNQLFPAISISNFNALTQVVRETIAADHDSKAFKAVNLWKVQQKRRPAFTKRRTVASILFI